MTEVVEDGTRTGLRILADLVSDGDVVVLSGAGLSTESGIPDYRGETGRRRRAEPMTYQAFTGSEAARRRYWARSHLGWRHIARAAPNAGHRARSPSCSGAACWPASSPRTSTASSRPPGRAR
ncbi:hypothetical protein [Actinomadura sp. WMMA1423]|uniref:hypothetical protein n=1 Tax=Actinomadura sp. WMMA1423 TaxID=2591108 RepID=UPI0034A3B1D8